VVKVDRRRGLGLALAVAMLAAPAARAADADDPVIAQRGDVALKASDVRQIIAMADPDIRQQMQRDPAVLAQKLRDRLLQLSILAEATAHQWDQRPDVAWRAELAREGAVEESYVAAQVASDPAFPSEAQIQAAYEANKSKLIAPRQYHVAQIFIAAPQSGTVQADADALRRATDLRQQIVRSHADFAALAKTRSDDAASAPNGGDLGWVREDGMLPAIRGALAGLPDGSVSDPVRSPQGWHVIKLLGTRPAAPVSLADARETLMRALRQERMVQAQRAYLANLLQQQPVKLNEIELSKFATK
jgi:parvulin-like peptidyl-prolyl isomerase